MTTELRLNWLIAIALGGWLILLLAPILTPFVAAALLAYVGDAALIKILSFVVLLLTIITGLGIVGLASFNVSRRTRQIGIRRAREEIGKADLILWVFDVEAGIAQDRDDLEALPDGTPGVVRRLIARCLRKDPRTRLPDMGAARLELNEVRTGEAAETAVPTVETEEALRAERGRRVRERWAWAAVALVAWRALLQLGGTTVYSIELRPGDLSLIGISSGSFGAATMTTLAAALALAVPASLGNADVPDESNCGQRTTVLDYLSAKYSEKPIAMGVAANGGLIEVLTSLEGSTFTIIVTMPEGQRDGSQETRSEPKAIRSLLV